jgi:hypothetical protein
MIFPEKKGKPRVSEQEARFAFVSILEKEKILYSVETPTVEKYNFSGETGSKRSASTDLTIFDENINKMMNIEFKSHGISMKSKTQHKIEKDIEKLLREDVDGLWFHVFERVDTKTIGKLLSVFAKKIKYISSQKKDIKEKTICFHICVLSFGFSIFKCVNIKSGGEPDRMLEENELRPPIIKVSKGLVEISSENGWSIHRHK